VFQHYHNGKFLGVSRTNFAWVRSYNNAQTHYFGGCKQACVQGLNPTTWESNPEKNNLLTPTFTVNAEVEKYLAYQEAKCK